MRLSFIGHRRNSPAATPELQAPLVASRIAVGTRAPLRTFDRRDVEFTFYRVFVPSLMIDHTELILRQAGVVGHEGFVVWAGTIGHTDAYVSSLIIPRATSSSTHGAISSETTSKVLEALDSRDLVPILQIHSHPQRAFLSETDAIRPIVAVPGFISIVIPDFGFVDLADVNLWSAHEFVSMRNWHELTGDEKRNRFVIDDSIIRVG